MTEDGAQKGPPDPATGREDDQARRSELAREIAQRLQDVLFADEARFQGLQYDASDKASKGLMLIHGGFVISVATWLQSSLGAGASSQQQYLVTSLVLALACSLAGLTAAAAMPFVANLLIGSAINSTGNIAMRTVNPVTRRPVDRDKDRHHRAESEKHVGFAAAWRGVWITLYLLSAGLFLAAGTIVVMAGFRAAEYL